MGADSAATYPNFDIISLNDSKMFSLLDGAVHIGCCGTGRAQDLLEFNLKVPKLPRKDADLKRWLVREFVHRSRLVFREGGLTRVRHEVEMFDGAMLVVMRGKIFYVEADFQTCEQDLPFAAIGSGGPYATGSLFSTARLTSMAPQARILEALEAAEQYNSAVRRPFKLVEV